MSYVCEDPNVEFTVVEYRRVGATLCVKFEYNFEIGKKWGTEQFVRSK